MRLEAVSLESFFCGRSSEIRTHDLVVPNDARYHLRYTPKRLIFSFIRLFVLMPRIELGTFSLRACSAPFQ